jgi:hypothetical protein
MTEITPLDKAHIAMEQSPDNDALRLKFYERLADSELFVLLDQDPEGEDIIPSVFPVEGGTFVLVFDREERLSEFVGDVAPYAALPGRVVAQMLAGEGLGLGVNLGVAPSSILIPDDAVIWLADTLGNRPSETEERPLEVTAPTGLPETLISALDTKLALAAGLAQFAFLVGVTYEGNRRSHLLAFVNTVEGANVALAQAAGEALTFSGIEAGEMDVAFFAASDPICAKLAMVGLRFDLPEMSTPAKGEPTAPGMNPQKPPVLR